MSPVIGRNRALRATVGVALCVAVSAVGLTLSLWAWPRQFSGILPLDVGREERYAVSSGPIGVQPRAIGTITQFLSKDEVLSLNSSMFDRIASERCFVAAQLPFSIALNTITEVEPPKAAGRLTVKYRKTLRVCEARAGTPIRVGPDEGEVVEVRPWSGIVPVPGASPMLQFSWSDSSGKWSSGMVMSDEGWQPLDADTAVYFAWRTSLDAAKASVAAGKSQLPQPRWGVAGEDEVNWIGSLLPGSGIELNDGTSVTLLEAATDGADGGSRIVVEIDRGGAAERRTIRADTEDPIVRFENPASFRHVFAVYGWAPGRAEARYFEPGSPIATANLEVGYDWRPLPEAPSIRLDQVLDAAAYAAPGESSQYEAVVRIAGRTVAVKEGSNYSLGEASLGFEAEVAPGLLEYDLAISQDGQRRKELLLSGRSVFIDGWRLKSIPHRGGSLKEAVFWMNDVRAFFLFILGVVTTALGLIGIAVVLVRLLRSRSRTRSA